MPAVSIPSASASETAASVSAVSSAASAASAASAVSSTAASSVVVSASASVVSVVVSVASVLLPHAVSIAIVIAADTVRANADATANNFFITLLISAFSNANLVSKTTKIYHGRFGKSIVYASFCYSYTYLKW